MSGAKNPQRRKITAREAAEKAGVSIRTVCNIVAEPRAEYLARAKARRQAVVDLRLQGLTYREIADRTGETFGHVEQLLHTARRNGEMPAVDGRTRQARAEQAAIRAAAAEAARPTPDPAPDETVPAPPDPAPPGPR